MEIPVLRFDGNDTARMMGAIFAENLHDLLSKVDDGKGEFGEGFFHTSTIQHEGSCYYKRIWTRDAGRGLIELSRLGFHTEAEKAAEYLLSHINHQDHWGRTTDAGDQRHYEIDGNALVLLGIYNAWKVTGKDKAKAKRYLDKVSPVINWVKELMDNSKYGELLPCQTEMAGNPNAPYNVMAIYPNYAMKVALQALYDMALFAGCDDAAGLLKAMKTRLGEAILDRLVSGEKPTHTPKGCWINGIDDRDGRVYDFSEWDGTMWPVYHWTRQLPFILDSDLGTLKLSQSEEYETHHNSYQYILRNMCKDRYFRKYGFANNSGSTGMGDRHDDTMCGYGQGFMTQAALISDDVNAYSKLIEGIARLAYDGDVLEPLAFEMNPWLMHECFNFENYEEGFDHTFGVMANGRPGLMNNPGDEGNLVQEAEIVKVLSVMAGIDGANADKLVVMPRIPWNWNRITAENFPYVDDSGEIARICYTMEHDRSLRTCSFQLHSSRPIKDLDVRVGPFPNYLKIFSDREFEIETCKNAAWIWLRGLNGTNIEETISLW